MRALLALSLLLLGASAGAHETLRLPWAFSDEPDLSADFGFSPGRNGLTQVEISLGGRFAQFGLPYGAPRAPRLSISVEISDPSQLEHTARSLTSTVDLNVVLGEYGLRFERKHFGADSKLVYKAEMTTALAPGDYNVRLVLSDTTLDIVSRRTLHVIVPAFEAGRWQVGDIKFITAVGKRLDARGKEQRVLDPNPWRQIGANLGWDLMVAYTDLGPRPTGALTRSYKISRLRGDGTVLWQEEAAAAPKKPGQVWVLTLPPDRWKTWQAGVYVLEVGLKAGKQSISATKTFEMLP